MVGITFIVLHYTLVMFSDTVCYKLCMFLILNEEYQKLLCILSNSYSIG